MCNSYIQLVVNVFDSAVRDIYITSENSTGCARIQAPRGQGHLFLTTEHPASTVCRTLRTGKQSFS